MNYTCNDPPMVDDLKTAFLCNMRIVIAGTDRLENIYRMKSVMGRVREESEPVLQVLASVVTNVVPTSLHWPLLHISEWTYSRTYYLLCCLSG